MVFRKAAVYISSSPFSISTSKKAKNINRRKIKSLTVFL